jgi:hypothetical protein
MNVRDFDLIEYLNDNGIPWKSHGKNIGKDSIGICCPECGDMNYHLGIKKDNTTFNCWRCHISGGLVDFIALIEGISISEAFIRVRSQLESFKSYEHDKNVVDIVDDIFSDKVTDNGISSIKNIQSDIVLPAPLFPLENKPYKTYYQYLVSRGFSYNVFKYWDCYFCSSGEYQGYLIFPIRINNIIVAFTSRAISKHKLRYKAQDKEKSIYAVTDCLYLYDEYDEGDDLFCVEGIFDVLRLRSFGYKSVGMFTNKLSDAQILLLIKKKPRKLFVMLDRGELYSTLKAWNQIKEFLNCDIIFLEHMYKDVGECYDRKYIEHLILDRR